MRVPTCRSTVTGSVNEKVEPWPSSRFDPEPAAMHLDDAARDREPEAGAALGARRGIVGLLELLEDLRLVGGGDAGPGVAHRDGERCRWRRRALIRTSPASVNLMALPTRFSSTCDRRRSSPRAVRQVRRHVELERELLARGQRLDRDVDALHHVLDRIVGERQRELPGLDLGKIEHVVDQAEQMLAVASARAPARRAPWAASRRRCSSRMSSV